MNGFQITCSEKDIAVNFQPLFNQLQENTIFLLKGNLGAGKTTFVREMAKWIGVKETVQSPTFNLVNIYPCEPNHKQNAFIQSLEAIYHFDLYRIQAVDEFSELYEQTFMESPFNTYLVFIEWPEKINVEQRKLFTEPCIQIEIQSDLLSNKRNYFISELV
ncbi:MAG: tRNA (adenosine(37)-N6)-threonylcarbamoyltransferase complex ATPase subunit type 1 TsaE [Candidatus Hydrogenedentota bacterium]|nr:MAG: tRNA (adenosine(37)-N6)-threonylcarbamoyltransferase complex ATPase subunit type 1 TsaE [Candidatus Hydrogenedentota bacterium]